MPTSSAARTLCIAGIAVALGIAWGGVAHLAAPAAPSKAPHTSPATFTFRYVPKPGTGPISVMRRTSVEERGGVRRTYVLTVKSRTTISPTEEGYRRSVSPISTTFTENGKPAKDEHITEYMMIPWSTDISKDGRLLRVYGYESALAHLQKRMPPRYVKAPDSPLSIEGFARRIRTAWDLETGELIGKTFRIGDVVEGTFRAPVDGEHLVLWKKRVRFAGTVVKDGRTWVRVKYFHSVTPDGIREWADRRISEMREADATIPKDFEFTDVTITETGEGLIDPANMGVYSKTGTLHHDLRVTTQRRTHVMSMTETTVHTNAPPQVKTAPKKARKGKP